jgi:hypothetical protein
MLTGEITACNLKDGYINLKLADRSINGVIWIAINGKTTTCTVAGTDKDLLSCALPPGITFPITISAAEDFVPTDFFGYDGSGCVVQTGPSGGGSGGEVATPCDGLGDCP